MTKQQQLFLLVWENGFVLLWNLDLWKRDNTNGQVIIICQSNITWELSAQGRKDKLLIGVIPLDKSVVYPWYKQGVPWVSTDFLPDPGIRFWLESSRRSGQWCVGNGTSFGNRSDQIWLRVHDPLMGFPGGSDIKESTCNVGVLGSIPGLGLLILISSKFVVQSLSHVWLCDLKDCSMPRFPVLHHLPEFTQVHVHWVVCYVLWKQLKKPTSFSFYVRPQAIMQVSTKKNLNKLTLDALESELTTDGQFNSDGEYTVLGSKECPLSDASDYDWEGSKGYKTGWACFWNLIISTYVCMLWLYQRSFPLRQVVMKISVNMGLKIIG